MQGFPAQDQLTEQLCQTALGLGLLRGNRTFTGNATLPALSGTVFRPTVSETKQPAPPSTVVITERHFQGGRHLRSGWKPDSWHGDAHTGQGSDVLGIISGGRRRAENTRSKQLCIIYCAKRPHSSLAILSEKKYGKKS